MNQAITIINRIAANIAYFNILISFIAG